MREICKFCGNSGTLLVDGYCVNRMRCEKRRRELVRQQRELIERARDLMLRLDLPDVAMVLANVLNIIYGV